MADGPPDEFDYDPAYEINTDDGWLNDANGNPIMGGGVDVNLDGLQGYAQKVYKVHQNFNSMAGTILSPMQEMARGAFGTPGQGLPWATAMATLIGHNMEKLMGFNQNISLGVMNVSYAAQTVANVYGDEDAGSAATLQAISFAFGNRKDAPDGVPQYVLDNVPTWNEFRAENPEVAAQMGPGVTPSGGVPVTNGDTTTTRVEIPQADGPPIVMETTQRVWTTGGGPYSGVVTTVTMNGKVQTVTSTTSTGYGTTTQVTTSYYDKDGNHQRDLVTSESTETWEVQGTGATTTLVTDTATTTYTYDDEGEQTGSTTTNQTVAVGAEQPDVPLPDPRNDPLYQERMAQLPQPG